MTIDFIHLPRSRTFCDTLTVEVSNLKYLRIGVLNKLKTGRTFSDMCLSPVAFTRVCSNGPRLDLYNVPRATCQFTFRQWSAQFVIVTIGAISNNIVTHVQ